MEKLKALSSFLKGFKRDTPTDVINAFFIVEKFSGGEFLFTFKNRDNNGVDSAEIRKFLFFNSKELDNEQEVLKEFSRSGEIMSKLESNELRWIAQYLKNGRTHLFPSESKKAEERVKELTVSLES